MNTAYLVVKGSLAEAMIRRNAGGFKPGHVIAVTMEEMNSWQRDVHAIEVPPKGKSDEFSYQSTL